MYVLGLDISTSTIGVALVGESQMPYIMNFIKPEGLSPLHKALNAGHQLRILLHEYSVDHVVIEKPAIMFRGGSSGHTVALLNWFGGAMAVQIWQMYERDPFYVAPATARKAVFGQGMFPKGTDTKKEVMRRVQQKLNAVNIGPTGRNGKMVKECYDIADAYVVARSVIDSPQLWAELEAARRAS